MDALALMQVSQEELQEKILHTWQTARESGIFGIPVIELHLGPIDISINKAIWFLWIGAAVTFLFLFIGSRLLKDRPGAYAVIVEEIYGFGRKWLGGQMGEEAQKWMPYTLSLFVFILTLNLLGLVPETYPVTSNISFTLTLALLTLILYQYQGIKRNGAIRYFKTYVPPNLPLKPVMVPFMFFVEALQQFVTQPLTLGMRLYANILAGHLVIYVFLGLILYFSPALALVSVPLAVVFYAFKIFISIIQAYIFAILTQVYIEVAMYAGEQH